MAAGQEDQLLGLASVLVGVEGEVRRREVEEVISRMKAAIAFYGLTEEDLGFKKPEKAASTPPAPAPAKKKKRKSRYTERPLAGPRQPNR